MSENGRVQSRQIFLPDISEYDVIIGYRADDSYFAFAQDFVAGVISLQKLSEAMRLGKLGEQIVLKSQKALERIAFAGYETVAMEDYYKKKMERDREARRAYRRGKIQSPIKGTYRPAEFRSGEARPGKNLFSGSVEKTGNVLYL